MGCILVYAMLLKDNQHELGKWLPANRILDEISDSTVYSSQADCFLKCLSIDKESIRKILEDGTVNFSLSKPRNTPKEYLIEGESISGKRISFTVQMFPRKAEVGEISVEGNKKQCDC